MSEAAVSCSGCQQLDGHAHMYACQGWRAQPERCEWSLQVEGSLHTAVSLCTRFLAYPLPQLLCSLPLHPLLPAQRPSVLLPARRASAHQHLRIASYPCCCYLPLSSLTASACPSSPRNCCCCCLPPPPPSLLFMLVLAPPAPASLPSLPLAINYCCDLMVLLLPAPPLQLAAT